MSSRLEFVKKHLVLEPAQKTEKDNGIFIVALHKSEFPQNLKPEEASGSAALADSLKGALAQIKLAPQCLEVIVMGSSLLATGEMPALTDKFSKLLGSSFGTYIMSSSSGLMPIFKSIKEIKFNNKEIVALGSIQKVKGQNRNEQGLIEFIELKKEDQSPFQSDKQNKIKNLWKLQEQQKLQFIKNLNGQENQHVQYSFEEPNFDNETIIRGGACSMILMSGQRISRSENIVPLAKILSYSQSPIEYSNIFISLFSSIAICLEKARLKIEDIDYFQFRQQYPIIPLTIARMFKIDKNKMNVHHNKMTIGGPSKVNGAVVVENLIFLMKKTGKKFGLAGICNDNGTATSIIIANVLNNVK